MIEALTRRALQPVDIASMAMFRVLFGLVALFGATRFLLYGWVDRFYVQPTFTFKYWGFSWVELLSPGWMTAAFVAMCVLSVCISLGFLYRASILAFFVVFTYVELIDVTNYLNHYYLVSLLALVMNFLPLHCAWSVDAKIWPALRRQTLPAWMLWALRLQVGMVYCYAGLAKLGSDWLLHAQPLNLWLSSRVDTPLIGPFLRHWHLALAMSWAGFLFDSTIVAWLLWKPTRPFAYALVVVFHFFTHVFFTIGLFPLIMVCNATIFLSPSWPRRFFPKASTQRNAPPEERPRGLSRKHRVVWAAFAALFLVQGLMPLRAHRYEGDVLWREQGMRWSWRVMVREKNGAVSFRVRVPGENRERRVPPSRYLTRHQEREMSGQPDLILQLAHHIAQDFATRGYGQVEVRVDAKASLNGRRAQVLIDPDTDLASISDGLGPAPWILSRTKTPPRRLNPLRSSLPNIAESSL